jgi:hypothetical protein
MKETIMMCLCLYNIIIIYDTMITINRILCVGVGVGVGAEQKTSHWSGRATQWLESVGGEGNTIPTYLLRGLRCRPLPRQVRK